MSRVILIANLYSTAVTRARVDAVRAVFEAGCDLTVWQTERRGHARELALRATQEADALVVFSGDGTYNEAVNGAAGLLPMGFLPGGGASVFTRALGLSRDPVLAARQVLSAIEDGRSSAISLGRVNERLFCFSAGIGFDAELVRRIDARGRDRDGRRAGSLAFIAGAAQSLRDSRLRIPAQLEIEGYGRASLVVVQNGMPYTYAGRVPLPALRAAEFTGGLDFAAPREVTPGVVPRLVIGLIRGSLADAPGVISAHDLDGFTVRCDRPLAVQADGEDLGDVREAVFAAERDALSVLR